MRKYNKGNVVKWQKQLWVVAGDNGYVVDLIPMNNSNSSAHPSESWPTPDTGKASVKLVAETVYGWMVQSVMRNVFEVTESLSGDGWTPR
jgi:hypothetical protein